MREAVPCVPSISFRQPPNLAKILCLAKLKKQEKDTREPNKPCNARKSKKCQLRPLLVTNETIISTATGRTHKCRNKDTDCNSTWLIYVISCAVCDLQYVSQISNFRNRMNGQKSCLRRFTGQSDRSQLRDGYHGIAQTS
jgi:hypothetical protein